MDLSNNSANNIRHDGTSPALFHYLPGWRGNLFLFILLISCSLIYLFYQMALVNKSFQKHSSELAMIVSGVVRLNIESTVLAQRNVEEIMEIFLGNSADFVGYLDSIEPLSSSEVTAFAEEARIAGVRLVRNKDNIVDGPPGWLPEDLLCNRQGAGLQHLAEHHLYTLTIPSFAHNDPVDGCIVIGLPSHRIEELRGKYGLDALLASLTALPGLEYIKIITGKKKLPANDRITARMVATAQSPVAETRLSLGDDTLVIGFDAQRFAKRMKLLKRDFFLFITVLALLGSFFSWLLYRYQAAEKNRVRDLERRLARQHEEASLGRATATIAHEVRNPLNAINMGLQRLQLEADELTEEHRTLLHSMETSVQRTNRIISDLQKYTRPVEIISGNVNITEIVESVLTLYRPYCRNHSIEAGSNAKTDLLVKGDGELLGQVIENLIKNAIEAQPDGGFIQIDITARAESVYINIENNGTSISWSDINKCTEPYFTTKTKGCGLGLAISKKIIEAHNGILKIGVDRDKAVFRVNVELPRANS